MKKRAVMTIFAVLALIALLVPSASDAADKKVSWRMVSVWGEGNSLLDVDRGFAQRVSDYTGGNFTIDVFPAGQLGSSNQVFDLVGKGTVEAGTDWPGYWAGKNTAFDILASSLNDFSMVDYYVWIYQAGGLDEYKNLYGKYGLIGMPLAVSSSESGLRCIKDFKTLADLKGAKVRISGKVQGLVAQKLGITPVMINVAELYEALQRGVIDAGEFTGPEGDESIKLHEVAKYWMTPGWHQSSTVNCVFFNKKAWESLPKEYQAVLERAAHDSTSEWLARKFWADTQSANRMLDEYGVKVNPLSKEDLDTISRYSEEATKVMCDENPDYKRIYDSMQAYRKVVDRYRNILGRFGYGYSK